MQAWKRFRIWRLKRQRAADRADFVSCSRSAFAVRYGAVAQACRLLSGAAEMPARRLAALYMTDVLAARLDADWWRENGAYCVQPWFVWAYCVRRGLVHPAEAADDEPWTHQRMLRPQGAMRGCVRLSVTRDTHMPQEGVVYLDMSEPLPGEWMQRLGLRQVENRFIRRVGERSAPLEERVAEMICALLEGGYAVCSTENALLERALRGDFTPEHRRWIDIARQPDQLCLIYPRDETLHRYAYLAGARWDGQQMVLPLFAEDRAEELMNVYGFRATRAAARRMKLWRLAVAQATVYQKRRWKDRVVSQSAGDLFQQMLHAPRPVIEELLECDE